MEYAATTFGKDSRVSTAFNQMLDTAKKVSDTQPDYEDFEAMERMVEEQMRSEGQDPHAKPKMSKRQYLESLRRYGDVKSKIYAQEAQLDAAAQEPDYDDFEGMERMVEEKMRRKGQDPHAKPKMSKQQYLESLKRFGALKSKIYAQEAQLDAAGQEPDYDDFEAVERMVEEKMRRKGQDPHARVKTLDKKAYDHGLKTYHRMLSKMYDQIEELEEEEEPAAEPPVAEPPVAEPPVAEPPPLVVRPAEVRPTPLQAVMANIQARPKIFAPQTYMTKAPVTVAGRSPLGQITEDEEEEQVREITHMQQLPRDLQRRVLFPGMQLETEEAHLELEDLPEEMVEVDYSPTTIKKRFQDIEFLYADHAANLPVFQGVAVTTPRPTVIPQRPTREPVKVEYPPSPPPVEEIEVPTTPTQVISKYPPEHFAFQYESPERTIEEMKTYTIPDTAGISPPDKRWYLDLDDLHHELWGTPEQKEPTVFDVPAERMYAESPPPVLAPVSPIVSPPIDKKKLKQDIKKGAVRPEGQYERWITPKTLVRRHTEGPHFDLPYYLELRGKRGEFAYKPDYIDYKMKPLEEAEEPPQFLTEEERFIREDIAAAPTITRRRPIRFPYAHMREVQRRSESPQLTPVRELYETPEKKVPGLMDLPVMESEVTTYETPPRGWASPVSPDVPDIDRYELMDAILKGAVSPLPEDEVIRQTKRSAWMGMRTRGQRPDLATVQEDVDAADFDQRARIMAATGQWPEKAFPRSKETPLSPITSPQRTPSPGEGPRRMPVRSGLKKRRIDFSPEEVAAHERAMASRISRDIIGERMPYAGDLPDFSPKGKEHAARAAAARAAVAQKFAEAQGVARRMPEVIPVEVSPERPVSPRTPPPKSEAIRLLREAEGLTPSPRKTPEGSPRTPEQQRLEREDMEYPEDLPEFEPWSPYSQPGVLEDTMAEVRAYTHEGRKRPKNEQEIKMMFKKYFRKVLEKIPPVPEEPMVERLATIHDEYEGAVEAEIEAERQAELAQRTLLDEPLPEDLPSPVSPSYRVFGYDTPPHLKPVPITRRPDPRVMEEAKKLYHYIPKPREEMEEIERLEQQVAAEAYLAEGRQYLPVQRAISPERADKVQRLADEQYASLATPAKKFVPPPHRTVEEVYQEILNDAAAEVAAEQAAKAAAAAEAKREKKRQAEEEKKARLLRLAYGKKGPPPPRAREEAKPARGAKPVPKAPTRAAAPRVPPTKAPPAKAAKQVKMVKSDKSVASAKSVKSEQLAKPKVSRTSVRSQKSDTSTAKPKKRPPARSKIDTGLKRKKKRAEPDEPREEVKFEVPGLKDLGLSVEDLANIDPDKLPQGFAHLETEPAAVLHPSPHISSPKTPQQVQRSPSPRRPSPPREPEVPVPYGPPNKPEFYDEEMEDFVQSMNIKEQEAPPETYARFSPRPKKKRYTPIGEEGDLGVSVLKVVAIDSPLQVEEEEAVLDASTVGAI